MIKKLSILILFALFATGLTALANQASGSKGTHKRLNEIIKQLENSNDNYVMVVAHRGDWRNAPENSIQAIKNCIEMGVDMVEIDVRMTKDSVLVLMHDRTLERTTTGKGKVADWTLDSLKTLNLKNGCGIATFHKIPTLEEAMELAHGNILVNLDKCSEYMDKAFEVINSTGTIDQVIFKGTKEIDKVHEQYGTLLDEIIYMPVVKESFPYLEAMVDDFLTEYKPVAFEVIYSTNDSPMFDVIKEIKENGSRVWVNTLWDSLCAGHSDDKAVNNPESSWGWVIEHGANIIQTDRPEALLEYLRKKGLHD